MGNFSVGFFSVSNKRSCQVFIVNKKSVLSILLVISSMAGAYGFRACDHLSEMTVDAR